jgi:23S rRNA G2445 N2-methylase RlmL
MAPGLARPRFSVERFAAFTENDKDWGKRHRAALRDSVDHTFEPRLLVADADPEACRIAKANAERVGVRLLARDAFLDELSLPREGATVVTNPPYGERLDMDASLLRGLRNLMSLDWRSLHLLAGSEEILRALATRPTRWLDLANGDLPVRLVSFE